VETPRVADPGPRKRNVRLVETLASGTREDRPPPWQLVPQALECLFLWLGRARDASECPLLLGATLHHGIVLIHPFLNGNGRTARVLASAVTHLGPPDCRVSIPSAFGHRPADYYNVVRRTLYRVGDFGDWLAFLSDRVRREGFGAPTCPDSEDCPWRFSFGEVVAFYGRFVEKVKAA
jgi:Fic family protein